MTTRFVTFYKVQSSRNIRLEFAIAARTPLEARLIAEKEMRRMPGYRLWEVC
jgi:hypothetical protein